MTKLNTTPETNKTSTMTPKTVKTSETPSTLQNTPQDTLTKSPKISKVAPMVAEVAEQTEKMDTSAEVEVKTSEIPKTLQNTAQDTLTKSPTNTPKIAKVATMVAEQTEKMDTSAEVVMSMKRKLEDHGSGASDKKIKYENKVFVAKLHRKTTAETLKEVFSKFGTVINVELPNNGHTKKHKGFAFISYEDKESVSQAISESLNLTVDDTPVFIGNHYARDESRFLHQKYQIRIRGVETGPISRDDLHNHFSKFGSIVCVKMLPVACIVAFENESSLVKAVEDANIQIKGATLKVFKDEGPVKKERKKKGKKGKKEQKVVDIDEDLQIAVEQK